MTKYRIVIENKLGTYRSNLQNEAQKEEIVKVLNNLQNLNSVNLDLDDGSTIYMNKGMIDRSVFLIEKVEEKSLTEPEAPASVANNETAPEAAPKNVDDAFNSSLYRGWNSSGAEQN